MIDINGHLFDPSKVSYISPIVQTGRAKYMSHGFTVMVDGASVDIDVSGTRPSAVALRDKLTRAVMEMER